MIATLTTFAAVFVLGFVAGFAAFVAVVYVRMRGCRVCTWEIIVGPLTEIEHGKWDVAIPFPKWLRRWLIVRPTPDGCEPPAEKAHPPEEARSEETGYA